MPETYSPLPNELDMKYLPDKLQKTSLSSVSGITVKQRGRYTLNKTTILSNVFQIPNVYIGS